MTSYTWEIEDAKRAIRLLEIASKGGQGINANRVDGRLFGRGPLPGEREWRFDWIVGADGRWLRVLREALEARMGSETLPELTVSTKSSVSRDGAVYAEHDSSSGLIRFCRELTLDEVRAVVVALEAAGIR